jgi:hypothetical protein
MILSIITGPAMPSIDETTLLEEPMTPGKAALPLVAIVAA